MPLTIDWTEYDNLPPREMYDAVGKIIDDAKAAVAAKRAEIAADLAAQNGAQQAADILGISGTRVYQLVARHKANTAVTTTEYGVWDTAIPGGATLRAGLLAFLGDAAATTDVDAVEADYRAAINQALAPIGVTLAGDMLYGPHPRTMALAEITAIIEDIDLGEIVARHDEPNA